MIDGSVVPAQAVDCIKMERPQESFIKSSIQCDSGKVYESAGELKCTNNCEDNTFDMDTLLDQQQDKKMGEVDVTDCTDMSVKLENEEDPDATEYSSSFGGTFSGSDDLSNSNSSDVEANSEFRGENEVPMMFDGGSRLFPTRKKRLTAHWKNYIQHLSWRCKWVELRMHELKSQAKRYERELLASANNKHPMFKEIQLESSASRFLPLSDQTPNKNIMRRRKRNRIEDSVDITSYMSHHNLFSYYEKRKFEADGSIDDEGANQVIAVEPNSICADEFGVNFEGSSFGFGDGDTLEQVLWTIEVLQSRVGNLKTELDKVVTKHSGRLSSREPLGQVVPGEFLTISPDDRHEMPVASISSPPHHISEYENEDIGMPASAVSSFGEATPHPDIIESTVGLLSGGNGSFDQSQIGDSHEETGEDILIRNQAAEHELQNFRKVSKAVEEPHVLGEELGKEKNASPSEKLPSRELVGAGLEKPVLRKCYKRRKKVERKAISGRWKAGRVCRRRRTFKK